MQIINTYYKIICCLLIAIPSLNAQTATSLSTEQLDSLYKSNLIKNNEAYQIWQKNLPKKKKQTIVNEVIKGVLIGALAGVIITAPITATCDLVAIPSNVISGGSDDCASITSGGILLGGGIGMLIGFGKGKRKSKKLKFIPDYH